MERTLGELLAEMIRYGDIHEAAITVDHGNDEEAATREEIASTILKLTNDGPGGSCSRYDKVVAPFLKQVVWLD